MKLTRLILGLAACAGLCACTNDEPAANGVAQETFDGDALYMVVKISDVGTSTRATEGAYANGSEAEYAVNDAYFYFYDESGVYVSQAEVWDGGAAVAGNTNIEFKGNTVIVLKGLTSVGYPNYMVTVLNQPSDFIPGGTLTEMQTTLASTATVGIMQGTNTYFTMSTSSYVNGLVAPFVTELTEDDFYEEPINLNDTSVKPVEIYVERLAAKVQTDVDEELANQTGNITLSDGTVLYLLDETVAGDPNIQDEGSEIGDQDIYVKIIGWGLNGTAKYSNIVKNIDATTWASGIDGWTGWSAPSDFRCFWGMSFNYGLGTYPTTSGGATDGTTLNDYLDYISYNDLTLAMSGYDYCAENTNTPAVLQTKNSSGITSVLVAAEVCDAEGNALDLVRYQGVLFEKDALLAYALNEEKAVGATVNVYTATTDATGETTYSQIDDSYLTLDKFITNSDGNIIGPLYDGYVVVVADEDAFKDDAYYYNTGTVDTDGNPVFAAYDDVAAAIAAVNDVLYAFDYGKDMNAFTGGAMYYNVPIEHLNPIPSDGSLLEANYGVVRNHWYSLSINAIENVGKGVFDPDEVIIPNPEDEKYYYVGANINILSWKLVSQSVTL